YCFFFADLATSEIYTLSLHDALPIFKQHFDRERIPYAYLDGATVDRAAAVDRFRSEDDVRLFLISIKAGGVGLNLTEADYVFVLDRKSTRLNSSHVKISYAVFCLKKK